MSAPGDIEIKGNPLMLSPCGHLRATSDRTFYDRTFSKLGKGSLRGSIFSLCASVIGSGVLSLPYVLKLCGYIEGTLFMILGATAAQVSLKMLAGLACERPQFAKLLPDCHQSSRWKKHVKSRTLRHDHAIHVW